MGSKALGKDLTSNLVCRQDLRPYLSAKKIQEIRPACPAAFGHEHVSLNISCTWGNFF